MSQQFYTMKELPVSERPYEKAKEQGVTALSDAELLAVLLKTGTHEKKQCGTGKGSACTAPGAQGSAGALLSDGQAIEKSLWHRRSQSHSAAMHG